MGKFFARIVAMFFAPKSGTKKADRGTIAGGALVAGLIAFVGPWEGVKTTTYLDIVGVPTVCYGETDGVELGQTFTKAECDAMFAGRLDEFARGFLLLVDDEVEKTVPLRAQVAFVSWSYNVGLGAAKKSTLVRKLNEGDVVGACNELSKWVKAGGRTVKGLVNRRAAERDMCLGAVT